MCGMTKPVLRRRSTWVAVAAVLAVAVAVGLAVFQPWKLFVDRTVDEAAPVAAAPAAPGPVVIARGALISHEHPTTGTVELLRLPDGSQVLRLENLDTSDGPVLKVWLTDQPVLEGRDGWYVFDDGRRIDLGDLKGNIGSSNYPLPAGTDLTGFDSVSIWCERFSVSFGAAALAPVAT